MVNPKDCNMSKINIHSVASLITNSSTVIYTYSNNSEKEVKELFNQIMKDFDIPHTFDELFNTVVLLDELYYYDDYLKVQPKLMQDWPKDNQDRWEKMRQLYKNVSTFTLPKPDWFFEAEKNSRNEYSGYRYPTSLFIIPKDEKYKSTAERLLKFLYSTTHEAFRDG